jgi:succinate dehydrogenase / fumarate reductase cytochrome b subunit
MAADFHLLGFPVVAKGEAVADVYSMVFLGFANPWVSLFYLVAISLLTVHLLHGFESMFQTIGWKSTTWAGWLRGVVVAFCLAYLAGNVAIPGLILSGVAKPAAGTTAAERLAAPASTDSR